MTELYKSLQSFIRLAWESDQRFILLGMVAVIIALVGIASYRIARLINVSEAFRRSKAAIIAGYQRLDVKAKTKLISRLQMSSNESEYRVKLGFFETMELRLVERSNIKSFMPFLNVYVLMIIVIAIFVFVWPPLYSVFNSWATAAVGALFIALIPTVILDSLTIYNAGRTRKTTANFLSLLLSWLEVKSDLLFAFDKVKDDVEAPLKYYLTDAVAQLKSGIDADQVFDILSYKINTEQFYTITKNFKSVFKNGGDIVELVKVLEEEAYMIDNEFENRVTDTFSTRMLLNVLLLGASFLLVGVIFLSPTLKALYTTTDGGRNVMFVAISIFVAGFIWNLKSGKAEY